jgi:hypothetical protein
MSKDEKLKSIIDYIEYAGLTFVEPFSLISSTVVEASYWCEIPKNIILMHINRTFKKKYGEQYIKCQKIAHEIAWGNNPDEERIMAMDLKPKEPKVRKEYERNAKSEFGKAYKEYTGLTSKANRPLYNACTNYYYTHNEFPWFNEKRWKRMCTRYKFDDKNIEEKVEK